MANPMELAGNGTQGWLAIYDTNFAKINDFLSRAFESKAAGVDVQIKGSGATNATSALLIKNSAGETALEVKNDKSVIFSGSVVGIPTIDDIKRLMMYGG